LALMALTLSIVVFAAGCTSVTNDTMTAQEFLDKNESENLYLSSDETVYKVKGIVTVNRLENEDDHSNIIQLDNILPFIYYTDTIPEYEETPWVQPIPTLVDAQDGDKVILHVYIPTDEDGYTTGIWTIKDWETA